jgi:hypothetical protein
MQILLELGPEFQKTLAELRILGNTVPSAVTDGLGEAVVFAAANVVEKFMTGQVLKRRTGLLAKNTQGWMVNDYEGIIGVRPKQGSDKYAWLLGDEQFTILPGPGKHALIIPIPGSEALTSDGASKWSSVKEAENALGADIFRLKGKNVLGYIRGKSKLSKFRPLFILVKSVFVQGTGALADGVLESTEKMTDLIQEKVDKVVDNG